eukprot:jgi/Ulvmu1/3699/UM170_0005.1
MADARPERHNVKTSPYLELHNPFTVWEGIKMLLLLPIAALRALLLILTLLLFALVSSLATAGARDRAPLPQWRRNIILGSRILGRFVLVCLGFWVNVDGWDHYTQARRSGVKLIIFNHPSWVDSVLLLALFAPSGVSRHANLKIPIVGTIIRSFQNIYTNMKLPPQESADAAAAPLVAPTTTQQISQRLNEDGWPMIAIAPEGMTSNNRYLLRFRTGAFVHRAPVLPVCIKYRWRHLNPSWTLGSEPWHLLRMLCQFANVVNLRILPTYVPSPSEEADAELFGEGVRLAMAEALRVPTVAFGIRGYRELVNAGVTVNWRGTLSAPPGVVDDDGFVKMSDTATNAGTPRPG